jgi:DNA-binding NarL/FixJ family response regulator
MNLCRHAQNDLRMQLPDGGTPPERTWTVTMRVLVADDQAGLRSAMRLLLEEDPEVEVIGEATEAKALLAKAETMRPHLVLLDWELPGMKAAGGGRELLLALHARSPHLHVIVLSGRPEAGMAALASGADYFVSKAEPPESLLAVLRRAKHERHADVDMDEA